MRFASATTTRSRRSWPVSSRPIFALRFRISRGSIPRTRPDPNARFVPRVEKIDAAIIASAGDSSSAVGTGGMITKIRSSRITRDGGIPSVICSGADDRHLRLVLAAERVGTLFVPPHARTDIAPRKLWIALGDAAHSSVTVDDGRLRRSASSAVRRFCRWASRQLRGSSEAGDVLDVRDVRFREPARGIAEAGSDELRLAGRQQREIAGNLLQAPGPPRHSQDNLIVSPSRFRAACFAARKR